VIRAFSEPASQNDDSLDSNQALTYKTSEEIGISGSSNLSSIQEIVDSASPKIDKTAKNKVVFGCFWLP
jgi:hypothetical protein